MPPYFRKSEANERGASEHHGADGPLTVTLGRPVPPVCEAFLAAAKAEGYPVHVDFNGHTQEGFGHYDTTTRNGLRWSAARAYLDSARARPNLTILTNTPFSTGGFFASEPGMEVPDMQLGMAIGRCPMRATCRRGRASP